MPGDLTDEQLKPAALAICRAYTRSQKPSWDDEALDSFAATRWRAWLPEARAAWQAGPGKALVDEAAKWERLSAVAASGTAESFMALPYDLKRDFFAMAVDDSTRRKRAEGATVALAEALRSTTITLQTVQRLHPDSQALKFEIAAAQEVLAQFGEKP